MADSGSAIVVASSKGGCGKTTLSTCLAVNLIGHGYRVAVIDADRNQALMTWFKTAETPSLTCTSCISHDEIVGHIMMQTETHDIVLVDTAGFENQTAIFAMGAADMVLIPVMPDRNSVLEARKTARQLIGVSQIARRPIPHRCLLSRWNTRGLAEKATQEDLDAMGLISLEQHLPELSAFKKATFGAELPRGGFIGLQIDRIIDELRELGAIGSKRTEHAA